MIDIYGHSHPHLHSPCPRCGYATRFKQFGPMRCACNRYWTKEAMDAAVRGGTWQARQRVAEYERSQETQ